MELDFKDPIKINLKRVIKHFVPMNLGKEFCVEGICLIKKNAIHF